MSRLVPKLRFKEFSGEWEEKRLEEIADITMGSSPKSNFYNEDKKGIPLLQGNADIKNRKSNPRIYTTQVTKECNKEDILLSVRAPVGAIAKSKHNACIGRGFSSIRVKENNYQEWLYQWLLQFEDKWSNISQGGTFDSVNSSDIKNLKIYIPKDPNEQQKIANTLSSLDNLIEAGEKKVEALKKHKEGLMQQLFPQEGEKIPKLRFEEFSGEWEEKRLNEVSDIVRGGSPRPIDKYMTSDPKGLNWLKIGDVDKNSKYVVKTEERVKHSALTKTREVHPGDLILSNSMSFGRPYIMKIKSCIHDGWIAITNIDSNIETDFLYYMILSPYSQRFFIDNAAGGGIRNLNADIIKSLPTYFPIDKKEQQKIANTLSSLDNLIEAQDKKVEALKKHKKGLMQQMFVSEE